MSLLRELNKLGVLRTLDDALSELFQTRIGAVIADGERFFRVRSPARGA